MAIDVVELDNLQPGDDVVVDTIASNMYQVVKVAYGATGSVTQVDSTNPLPISIDNIPTTATDLGKAVDAASGASDVGVAPLYVRDDALTALTPVDGDYVQGRVNANGALWVVPDGTVTVDGTITANAGTNLNTSLLALESGGNLATLAGAVSGTEVQVDVLTSALPTGSSTAANQATANAALAAIQTAVEILDNVVAGTEAQVDVVTSTLPTGAATSANQTTANSSLAAIETSTGLLDNAIAGTEMQVDVVAALPAGTNNIGDVDIASALPAGSNTIGNVGTVASTSGGSSPFYTRTATLQAVKASPGQVYVMHVMNLTAAKAYLQVFNLGTGSVTLGTTTPTMQFAIPTVGDTNGAGFTLAIPDGLAFSTAISIAVTSDDEGSTTLTAGQATVNLGYK